MDFNSLLNFNTNINHSIKVLDSFLFVPKLREDNWLIIKEIIVNNLSSIKAYKKCDYYFTKWSKRHQEVFDTVIQYNILSKKRIFHLIWTHYFKDNGFKPEEILSYYSKTYNSVNSLKYLTTLLETTKHNPSTRMQCGRRLIDVVQHNLNRNNTEHLALVLYKNGDFYTQTTLFKLYYKSLLIFADSFAHISVKDLYNLSQKLNHSAFLEYFPGGYSPVSKEFSELLQDYESKYPINTIISDSILNTFCHTAAIFRKVYSNYPDLIKVLKETKTTPKGYDILLRTITTFSTSHTIEILQTLLSPLPSYKPSKSILAQLLNLALYYKDLSILLTLTSKFKLTKAQMSKIEQLAISKDIPFHIYLSCVNNNSLIK